MPATTRRKTKQARIDNPAELKAPVRATKKRKAADTEPAATAPSKKQKSNEPKAQGTIKGEKPDVSEAGDSITINRAPVLELWAACVSAFLHDDLPWETCLSAGGAISTLCAISKGRSIGAIGPVSDPATAEKKRKDRRERAGHLDELEVMGFDLKVKDGTALVGDKPKKANESALKHKFGDDAYERTRSILKDSLTTWKDSEEELNARAFHMYEDFRPTVPPGQKGWGRKGQLNLEAVKQVVEK